MEPQSKSVPSVDHRSLPSNQVHIWQIPLTTQPTQSLLSQDELQRANRFHSQKDRHCFTTARAALRQILSQIIKIPANEITFTYSPTGKPELKEIQFNLSHSHDHAVLAITPNHRIGTDMEFVNPERATDAIATRFFAPNEAAKLQSLPPEERLEAFFQCWTRKEAYVKAIGSGLSLPLSSFEVTFGPNTPPSILQIQDPVETASHWRLYNIPSPQGYAAAVAVEGAQHELIFHIWNTSAGRPELTF